MQSLPLVPGAASTRERLYHVTVASNFARAFDKYSRRYDKAAIPESTYSDRFFLLRHGELSIGVKKASGLLERKGLAGDRLLVLETRAESSELHPNLRTGLGRYVARTAVALTAVHWVSDSGELEPTSFEEAHAWSLRCIEPELAPYATLTPRTLSVLPIARACQAACRFCFSESSVSLDQAARVVDAASVRRWMRPARNAGAQRFVITGGGEPGLLKHASLTELIAAGAEHFDKVVLITNGVHLARRDEARREAMLQDYAHAGLSVLALSRHHDDAQVNAAIMGLDTGTERVLQSLRRLSPRAGPQLHARLICVLQQGGIASVEDVKRYLKFASDHGVNEVCFKELYVSTTLESAYHAQPENTWSREHQVSLSVVLQAMDELGFAKAGQLPWGAPFFQGSLPEAGGQTLRVAAYTEPSVFWERSHGVLRSWNLMADGTCLASLEDPASTISLSGAPRRVIPLKASA